MFVEIMWKGKGAMGGAKRRIAYTRVALSQLHPATRVYDASMPPDGEKVPWSQEGWLDLTSDALAARGRGSTTLRHQRPMGHVLTRMTLQQPQAVRNLSPLPSSWRVSACAGRPIVSRTQGGLHVRRGSVGVEPRSRAILCRPVRHPKSFDSQPT